ncbi:MAG: nucleotidyltransferase substrate binding protein [Thermoguttaceae bacterium]|nr:nucleotidyltransferase substrate binding protein [Thermoguttaceae bacterium]
MKKFENFKKSLDVLLSADKATAHSNEIYRTGVIGQYNLTFELAWKAIQSVMRIHSVDENETGSPREVIKLAYKIGFIDNAEQWQLMLKKRNVSIHIYNEKEINEMIDLIFDQFIETLIQLRDKLEQKINESNDNWDE